MMERNLQPQILLLTKPQHTVWTFSMEYFHEIFVMEKLQLILFSFDSWKKNENSHNSRLGVNWKKIIEREAGILARIHSGVLFVYLSCRSIESISSIDSTFWFLFLKINTQFYFKKKKYFWWSIIITFGKNEWIKATKMDLQMKIIQREFMHVHFWAFWANNPFVHVINNLLAINHYVAQVFNWLNLTCWVHTAVQYWIEAGITVPLFNVRSCNAKNIPLNNIYT